MKFQKTAKFFRLIRTNMLPRGFAQVPHDPANLTFITFKNPMFPIVTEETVLSFFCDPNNPFYERQCDNEQVRMQSIGMQMDPHTLNEAMLRLTGIQYVLHRSSPPLFVVCKHRRNSPNSVAPLAYYYILDNVVYQAPDLYTACQSRIAGAVEPLRKALSEMLGKMCFNAATGYYWDFKGTDKLKRRGGRRVGDEMGSESADADHMDTVEGADADDEDKWPTRPTVYQHTRTEFLLHLLREEFPEEAPASNAETELPPSDAPSVAEQPSATPK